MSTTAARRLRLALLAAAPLACLLSACSPPADALPVATDATITSADGDMGALQGRLEGRIANGRACFWVDGPNGRAFLVLPKGSYAGQDRTLHASGSRVGELHVGRRYLFLGAPDFGVAVDGCEGPGAAWYTGQVRVADPRYSRATLPAPKRTVSPPAL